MSRDDRARLFVPFQFSILTFLLIALTGGCSSRVSAGPADPVTPASADPVHTRLEAILKSYYPAGEPGAIVLGRRNGTDVIRSAHGVADLELSVPLNADHRMKIGSITKSFTAAAILSLVDAKRLNLTDTIGTHLPEWPASTRDVTIEQLLTHRAGVRDYTPLPEYGASLRQDATREHMLGLIAGQEPEFAPGTNFRYTNSAYFILGAIVEKVSGTSLHAYVSGKFLEPLAMNDTTFDDILAITPRRVTGYQRDAGRLRNAHPYSPTRAFAVGDMLSTASDLATWFESFAAGRAGISDPLRTQALTEGSLPGGKRTGYGYGWFLGSYEGEPVIEHGGDLPGFSAHVLHLPRSGVTVVVLSNDAQHDPRPDFVATQVASFLIGRPFDPPPVGTISLTDSEIRTIAGTYVSASGTQRTILVEGQRVFLERSGRRTELSAVTATYFVVPRTLIALKFVRNAAGETELVLEQRGREIDRGRRRE